MRTVSRGERTRGRAEDAEPVFTRSEVYLRARSSWLLCSGRVPRSLRARVYSHRGICVSASDSLLASLARRACEMSFSRAPSLVLTLRGGALYYYVGVVARGTARCVRHIEWGSPQRTPRGLADGKNCWLTSSARRHLRERDDG